MGELKKPSSSEMCTPGTHLVHEHERVCKSGTASWVHTHIRKNKGKIRPGLLKENIHFLFWTAQKKYSSLNAIVGFKDKGSEYDALIQFWLEYWKSQGMLFPNDLEPLMIKALIAKESTFNPNEKNKVSTAAGLMQITEQSLRILGGHPNTKKWIEVRNNLIHVKKDDRFDPVVNIALGVRWLGYKFSQIPKQYAKTAQGVLIGYHSFNKDGETYAKQVLTFYEKSKGQ
jgi:soluble lytic murein transglycosylase-like protein